MSASVALMANGEIGAGSKATGPDGDRLSGCTFTGRRVRSLQMR